MAGPLGCAEEYTVGIYDRTGQIQQGELLNVSEVSWGRVLDDTSEAQATIPYQGPDCCELLGDTHAWCHDLALFRDGLLVWQGPVTHLQYGRDTTVIQAKDITAWLYKRVVKTLIDFTATGSGAADLVTIAAALVTHGYGQDDPNVLPYLLTVLSGVVGERQYKPNSAYVGDELQELARTGVDYTAIGHRLILAGEMPIAQLPALADEDFAGELQVVEDGRAAATAATVVGKGVLATSGGAGPCGLLEVLATEEQILDQPSAQAEADAIVMAGNPTPLYLQVPDGAQLAPEAPVAINDLVPGVIVPVTSSETCRTVAASLRLQKVTATFGAEGEKVGVTLVPIGVENTT